MKIMHLIMARQYRGAELFANQLASRHATEGHQVIIVSLFNYPTRTFVPGTVYVDLDGDKGKFVDIRLLFRLRRVIMKFRPEIIQANAGETLKYAFLVRLFLSQEIKLLFRNASTISQYLKNPVKRFLQGVILRRADYVVSVSELSRQDITRLFPFLSKKTTVIPVGVDLFTGKHCFKTGSSAVPTFLHVGGFTFEKNHERLLHIFVDFLQQSSGKLIFAGDGILRPQIEKIISDLNLSAHVEILGVRQDVPELIRNATALVLPSVIEGLPSVILEAFSVKTPVIAYDVGGIHEIVKPGETGWLVPLHDEKAFVEAMLDVSAGQGRHQRVLENAFELVKERYAQDKISARFLDVYSSLNGKNQNPAHY